MVKKIFRKMVLLFILAPLCFGFRAFVETDAWVNVSNDTEKTRKLFVKYEKGSHVFTNDIEISDPLRHVVTANVDAVMQSIFDDYNNVNAAYLNLVPISDSDYDEATSPVITLKTQSSGGNTSGEASPKTSGGQIESCEISLDDKNFDSLEMYIGTVTHEIGHCLGLLHPQETVSSVMSYFSSDIRLQIDDKMGVSWLYPKERSKLVEKNTLGLSCTKGN